jgi:hypothetical protein
MCAACRPSLDPTMSRNWVNSRRRATAAPSPPYPVSRRVRAWPAISASMMRGGPEIPVPPHRRLAGSAFGAPAGSQDPGGTPRVRWGARRTEGKAEPFGPHSGPHLARGFFIVSPARATFHRGVCTGLRLRFTICIHRRAGAGREKSRPSQRQSGHSGHNRDRHGDTFECLCCLGAGSLLRRRRHVGYSLKSRYTAAPRQVKSWAMCGRLRVGKCFLHACRSGVAAMCSAC